MTCGVLANSGTSRNKQKVGVWLTQHLRYARLHEIDGSAIQDQEYHRDLIETTKMAPIISLKQYGKGSPPSSSHRPHSPRKVGPNTARHLLEQFSVLVLLGFVSRMKAMVVAVIFDVVGGRYQVGDKSY